MQLAMVNDKLMPMEQLDPAYMDRGLFFGDGVYEVLRSYDGRIFALDEHLNRFRTSLQAIGITAVDVNDVRRRVEQAFQTASIANARIYFHVTRGSGPRSHVCSAGTKPNFFLTVTQLPDSTQKKLKGIAVATYPDLRWKRCDIKSLNLLANVLARQDAAAKGCDEAILVDDSGVITEGAASAFFAIIGKTLRTAPLTANILPSISRQYILRGAASIGLTVSEQSLTCQDAGAADELFIAVTTEDIVPVVKFDGTTIANGWPGPYTRRLIEEFRKFVTAA